MPDAGRASLPAYPTVDSETTLGALPHAQYPREPYSVARAKALGRRLLKLRRAARKSHEQLADDSGIGASTLADYERGFAMLHFNTPKRLARAQRLAEALGATVEDLTQIEPKKLT